MIFIWIPKTGGTSFVTANPRIKLYTENYHLASLADDVSFGHASPHCLLESGIISIDWWRWHEKIALVRHPWARFLSLYQDYKRTARIPQNMNQREFAHAIKEMKQVPGLFNSRSLSMCAPQVCWLLPGVKTQKIEDMPFDYPLENTASSRILFDDSGPVELVNQIYAVDFATLGYNKQWIS